MKRYYNIEGGFYETEEEIRNDFTQLCIDWPEEYDYTFEEYLNNCMVRNNGALQTLEERYSEVKKDLQNAINTTDFSDKADVKEIANRFDELFNITEWIKEEK